MCYSSALCGICNFQFIIHCNFLLILNKYCISYKSAFIIMYSLYLRRLHSYYTKDLQKMNAPLLEYLPSMDIEWFALEMNRDHSFVFEIASKYYISDSFVDHDGYSISSKGFLPTVVDITHSSSFQFADS